MSVEIYIIFLDVTFSLSKHWIYANERLRLNVSSFLNMLDTLPNPS